jgi:cardiolipin synthase (CMP-forming)
VSSQLLTAPNQITLLRLIFVPFIVISLTDGSYGWALGLFVVAGISDGLDGLLARKLNQRTVLGQYLDPIADKMLLSTLFLVLAITHKIPWKFTIIVFSRDLIILITCAVLFAATSYRDFRPSIYGKMNTAAQIGALFFVLLNSFTAEPNSAFSNSPWIYMTMRVLLWMVFALTIISGIHYVLRTGYNMRAREAGGEQS